MHGSLGTRPLLARSVSPMAQQRRQYSLFLFFLFSSFCFLLLARVSTGTPAPVVTEQVPTYVTHTRFVSKHRPGAFRSIQKAIDSVPSGNDQWVRIHVEAGVYSEVVLITADKPFILLEGEGRECTIIEWGAHATVEAPIRPATTTAESATFTVYAANFVARWIGFKNTFRMEGMGTRQAVAAMIAGDRSSFYGCSFIGFQDTLSDLFGRHYFKDCYIEGAIDFIFGFAQSIYEGCTLFVSNNTVPGFVTAQGRPDPTGPGGYVFKGCNLTGDGKAYLGRAWGPYARVVFYQTNMYDGVVPEGWNSWNNEGREKGITFAESHCTGPGSETSQRVYWAAELDEAELTEYTSITFIDDEGWLAKQAQ